MNGGIFCFSMVPPFAKKEDRPDINDEQKGMKKKVAIQGIAGSYHDVAAQRYFEGETVEPVPCDTFREVIEHVSAGTVGMMAIENTIAGSLLQNHELIREGKCRIVGEYKLRIMHSFAALPGTRAEDITEVNSHPIALMQCRDFLDTLPGAKLVECDDTAGSARWVAEKQMHGHGVICARRAAEMYGLEVLAEGVETNKRNYTRFLVIARPDLAEHMQQEAVRNKASLVFALPHTSGSLSKVLTILSFYDMNLSKIQSLPIIGREWEYMFYVNLTFEDYTRYRQALEAIIPLTNDLKILGEYEQGKQSI